ncbi:hypothetical protein AXK58_19445 [Tsukamurella tyrosinosolvens]|nr:hypothetical protein AXK58_19445 [Tsukamurella tyrosinosolvens]
MPVPASAGTDRLSEPAADGCRHSIHVEPDGTELQHLNAICPVVHPLEGERVIEVGPPAEPITPAALVEPGDIPI